MKPLLCFDLDETLIYSNPCHIKAFNKTFEEFGLKRIEEKKFAKLLQGEIAVIIIKKIYPKLPKEIVQKIVKRRNEIVIKETYKYAKQIDNSAKVLKTLKKNYRIAVLSNCIHKEIFALLKGAKIPHNLVDRVIGKDEVKHTKPYPDEIFKAEKLLHEKAKFMIGDSIFDIKAAKKAKTKVISVLTGNTPKTKIIKAKPDYILRSVKYLPKLLKEV